MTDTTLQSLKTGRLSTQAEQYLVRLIEGGTFDPGDRLPSEHELAAQLGISRATLREALQNLEQQGVVVRRHGVGTFVARSYTHLLDSGLERLESILELAARRGLPLGLDALEVRQKPADATIAEKLLIPHGSPVTSVERIIRADETPVAYMMDVTPASVLSPEEIGESFAGSVLDLLRQRPDLNVSQAVAVLVACSADRNLARRLEVRRGEAILLIEEVLFNDVGQPVEFSCNYFLPAFFRFHVVRRL
jgi:GntR family transcriptional regulator